VSSPREHGILRRYPAFAGALLEAGNTLGERGVA